MAVLGFILLLGIDFKFNMEIFLPILRNMFSFQVIYIDNILKNRSLLLSILQIQFASIIIP